MRIYNSFFGEVQIMAKLDYQKQGNQGYLIGT